MKIGLVDADLIDNGTRFPNLALMKIAGYYKDVGKEVSLVLNKDGACDCDKLFVSKVFTKTKDPPFLSRFCGEINKGGTGYYLENAPCLPNEIEHHKPYYDLYKNYYETFLNKKQGNYYAYAKASIGFTTRGCFRKCPFCVNKNKNQSELWSPIDEFYDPSKRFIFLLDDNVFACKEWKSIFEQLKDTKKAISFRQGLDLRLIDEEKSRFLQEIKYYKDVYFAFDNVKDKEIIKKKLETYRKHCDKQTSCYVLLGYYEAGIEAIESLLERIEILSKYNVVPYVMQYESCRTSQFRYVFAGLARQFNFKPFAKKYTYFEAAETGSKSAIRDAYQLLPDDLIKKLKKRYF